MALDSSCLDADHVRSKGWPSLWRNIAQDQYGLHLNAVSLCQHFTERRSKMARGVM
jgi:hypothetical protein